MCDYTRMDKIKNRVIRDVVKVTRNEYKIRETRLRWFGHMKKMSVNAQMRKCARINIPKDKRGRRWHKKSLDEVIRDDLRVVGLTEDMA